MTGQFSSYTDDGTENSSNPLKPVWLHVVVILTFFTPGFSSTMLASEKELLSDCS